MKLQFKFKHVLFPLTVKHFKSLALMNNYFNTVLTESHLLNIIFIYLLVLLLHIIQMYDKWRLRALF